LEDHEIEEFDFKEVMMMMTMTITIMITPMIHDGVTISGV
jgi:hypothetical protein